MCFPPPTVAKNIQLGCLRKKLYISHTEDGSTNIAPPRASIVRSE